MTDSRNLFQSAAHKLESFFTTSIQWFYDIFDAEQEHKQQAMSGGAKEYVNYGDYLWWHKGNVQEAVDWYEKAARLGNPEAQYSYGHALFYGEGITADKKIALEWIKRAADKENPYAFLFLGLCFIGVIRDTCVTKNTKQGFKFLVIASKKLPVARIKLGVCYFHGIGVEQDEKKAIEIIQNEAKQGYAPAQSLLGNCLIRGIGLPKDTKTAIALLEKIQDKTINAKIELARCYEFGIGVGKDETKAAQMYQEVSNYDYARCLEFGKGLPRDEKQAFEKYQIDGLESQESGCMLSFINKLSTINDLIGKIEEIQNKFAMQIQKSGLNQESKSDLSSFYEGKNQFLIKTCMHAKSDAAEIKAFCDEAKTQYAAYLKFENNAIKSELCDDNSPSNDIIKHRRQCDQLIAKLNEILTVPNQYARLLTELNNVILSVETIYNKINVHQKNIDTLLESMQHYQGKTRDSWIINKRESIDVIQPSEAELKTITQLKHVLMEAEKEKEFAYGYFNVLNLASSIDSGNKLLSVWTDKLNQSETYLTLLPDAIKDASKEHEHINKISEEAKINLIAKKIADSREEKKQQKLIEKNELKKKQTDKQLKKIKHEQDLSQWTNEIEVLKFQNLELTFDDYCKLTQEERTKLKNRLIRVINIHQPTYNKITAEMKKQTYKVEVGHNGDLSLMEFKEKKEQKEIKQIPAPVVSQRRYHYLNSGIKHFIPLAATLDSYSIDKKFTKDRQDSDLLEKKIHYALLYNISKIILAIKLYQKHGDQESSPFNYEFLETIRNKIFHHGILHVTFDSVIKTANTIILKMPVEFKNIKKPYRMVSIISEKQCDELRFSLDLLPDDDKKNEDADKPFNLMNTDLIQELLAFEGSNRDHKNELTDSQLLSAVYPSIDDFKKFMLPLKKDDRRLLDEKTLMDNFHCEIDAIKMLLTIIGEYVTAGYCELSIAKANYYLEKKIEPQEEYQCIKDFYQFLLTCKQFRNFTAHEVEDIRKGYHISMLYEIDNLAQKLITRPNLALLHEKPKPKFFSSRQEHYEVYTQIVSTPHPGPTHIGMP